MNCIIIDDDKTARQLIKQLILKTEGMLLIDEFSSAIDAIKYLNANDVDLIFLDIHMPTFSGFDFIQTLKSPPKIILTTSDKDFAIQAFEYDCVVDYIVKPITKERFKKSLNKIQLLKDNDLASEKVEGNNSFIYVNISKRLIKINIPDIYLVKAKGDYIIIKTNARNYLVHSRLNKIEDKLPSYLFLRIHRSYIINISQIVDIQNNSVLVGKTLIPIGRAKKSELVKKINLL
ncbi:MAG: Transcriptional regulatory protein YpdB [Polaribacter sejongensis]|nr:MAG: Transcriptional regulatory protein YpdB [Polaribacter sejongensis]